MKYEKIKEYNDKKFRRITGLKKRTYEKCVEICCGQEKLEQKGQATFKKSVIKPSLKRCEIIIK